MGLEAILDFNAKVRSYFLLLLINILTLFLKVKERNRSKRKPSSDVNAFGGTEYRFFVL